SRSMRSSAIIGLLSVAAAACSSSHSPPRDGAAADLDAATAVRCGPEVCEGSEACCLLTLTCITTRAECAIPPGHPSGTCGSDLDCAAGELCWGRGCFGPGQCVTRNDCRPS